MTGHDWLGLLKQVEAGDVSPEDAERQIEERVSAYQAGYETLPDAHVDISREERTGFPEVIYGEGKTADQIVRILGKLDPHSPVLLATRVDEEKAAAVLTALPNLGLTYHPAARLLHRMPEGPSRSTGYIAVLCAGTSDLPVAEEAALTAEAMGSRVERLYDVGVSGLHRLLSKLDTVRGADALVVVAGMEGALVSVVGGLVRAPVFAVPTSIGYGAHFQGMTPLLGMLSSCAPGVSVVNIDNGYGAGYCAGLIHLSLSKQGES